MVVCAVVVAVDIVVVALVDVALVVAVALPLRVLVLPDVVVGPKAISSQHIHNLKSCLVDIVEVVDAVVDDVDFVHIAVIVDVDEFVLLLTNL